MSTNIPDLANRLRSLSQKPWAVEQRKKYWSDPEFRKQKAEKQRTPEAKAKAKAKRQESFAANPTLSRWVRFERALWKNYRMTVEQYARMEHDQHRRCAVCKKPLIFVLASRDTVVDHDHLTNKIRGLLHSHCNFLVSKETPELLRQAADYIERHWS